MPKFRVYVPKVEYRIIEVEAPNANEAPRLVCTLAATPVKDMSPELEELCNDYARELECDFERSYLVEQVDS
jgi:hypothetical protein